MSNYLDDDPIIASLNPEQRQAALSGDGAYLVIAGPGTGKTHTMTARAHCLAISGTSPSDILMMTFTKKAAREISERLTKIDPAYAKIKTGTFHSVAIRLLREYGQGDKLAIVDEDDERSMFVAWWRYMIRQQDKKPDIFDEKDALDMLYSAYRQRSYRDNEPPVWSWAADDSGMPLKAFEKAAGENLRFAGNPEFQELNIDEAFVKICGAFDARKLVSGKLSYDDCIIAATNLLRENNLDIGARYVSVDEFQDSDKSQLDFVRELVRPHGNVFAVGDDKQSIYCWRGAYPAIFDDFRRSYPDLGEISLVRNYRSTAKIIDAVNSVARARPVHSDMIMPTGKEGSNPVMFNSKAPEKSALSVIRKRLANGCSPSDIAVLYRSHYGSSQKLQLELAQMRIPFVLVGGKAITERLLFKRFRDCLRVINDPSWNLPLFNLVRMFPEIGPKAADTISQTLSNSESIEKMLDILSNDGASLAGKKGINQATAKAASRWIGHFLETMEKYNSKSSPVEIFDSVMPQLMGLCGLPDKKRIKEYLSEIHDLDNAHDALNTASGVKIGSSVKGIAGIIRSFSQQYSTPAQWLDALSVDDTKEEQKEAIVLTTIHGAKGKEWDTVVIGDCCDAIFFNKHYSQDLGKRYARENPSENFEDWAETAPETMEIRNLFYVALSRAKNHLAIVRSDEFRLVDELIGHGCVNTSGEYSMTAAEVFAGLEKEEANAFLADRKKLAEFVKMEENEGEKPGGSARPC